MYITRECEKMMEQLSTLRPVISVMGPRQAGKTKMIMHHFPHLPYYDLEDKTTRDLVEKNPIQFVRDHIQGAIFDEIHYVPEIAEALCRCAPIV